MSNSISWSFGRNQYDNYPKMHMGTWEEFIDFCNAHKAPKKGLNYVNAYFGNDGRRCLENASTRDFIALDMDGNLSDEDTKILVGFFSQLKAFCYETASSVPEARRMRFMIKTDRPVGKGECKAVSKFVESLSPNPSVFDPCTHGIVQPIYLPPTDKPIIAFDGAVLEIDPILQRIPEKAKRVQLKPIITDDIPDALSFFQRNGLVLKDCQHGGLDVICLWADSHTKGDITGTVFYPPDASNNYLGGYKCQHHHCEDKAIGDIYRYMRGRA